ncbi:MAG: 30S ribosomal protein S11 [Rickettsiaceae bacterium]
MNLRNTKSKKAKKNITLGIVCIKVTFNNTIITITDVQGNVIVYSTSGSQGFKGAKKATPYAAQVTSEKVSAMAKEHGVKTVSIKVKGAGSQREAAMMVILNEFIVTMITDISSVPHNGTRPPKRRRV